MSKLWPFGIRGYRSFGETLVRLPEISKITLFAGANNSGKSNILRFVYSKYNSIVTGLQKPGQTVNYEFTEVDRHVGSPAGFSFSVGLKIGGSYHKALNDRIDKMGSSAGTRKSLLLKLLEVLKDQNGIAWFDYHAPTVGVVPQLDITKNIENGLVPHEWSSLWLGLTNHTGGGALNQHWIPETMAVISPKPPKLQVYFLDAFRKVGPAGQEAEGYSGIGIIERLAQLQNPPRNRQEDKKRFQEINAFLQNVIDDPEALLEIPYARDTILVHQGQRVLPLESLGTGIHQVVILAAASTVLTNATICLEEPELHLHPILQRKLITYLSEKTNNQYLITTHSAHLMGSTPIRWTVELSTIPSI